MAYRPKQLSLDLARRKRTPGKKLGRLSGPNPRIRHRTRDAVPAHCPVHVTLRIRRGLPSLRKHRVGRAVNRVFGHKGPVLADRYHLRLVQTPLDARHTLVYVLLNARHHWMEKHGVPPPVKMDDANSGMWFDGWKGPAPPPPHWQCDVARPSTWLLRTGWRKHGLIDPSEVPGIRLRRRSPAAQRV